MQALNVTLVQADILWEDKKANLRKLENLLAPEKGKTDLVVLPEMFSTGFTMNSVSYAEDPGGSTLVWMQEQAEKLRSVVTGSFIVKEGAHYFNRLHWVLPGGEYKTYDKKHLFSMAGEDKHFTGGNEKLLVDLKGWKMCPMVCFDLRFPVWVRNKEDYDGLIFIANWPQKRINHWHNLLIARSIENQCYTIGLNRVGKDGNGICHNGSSMVVDPVGEKLLQIQHVEQVSKIALDYDTVTKTRRHMPFLKDRDLFTLK